MSKDFYRITFDPEKLPLGIDTADVNGPVNINKDGSPKLSFGIARCGEGIYRDTQYQITRAQYDKAGLPFIAYHVLRPNLDLDKQILKFKSWAGSGCYGYSWDLEVTGGVSPSAVSSATKKVTLAMLDAGYNVINYSSPGWIKTYFRSPVTMKYPDWVNSCYWYLAQYADNGECNYIDIPIGLNENRVLVVQTWNKAPNQYGSKYDSVYVDRDRWLRDYPVKEKTTVTKEDYPEKMSWLGRARKLFIR